MLWFMCFSPGPEVRVPPQGRQAACGGRDGRDGEEGGAHEHHENTGDHMAGALMGALFD